MLSLPWGSEQPPATSLLGISVPLINDRRLLVLGAHCLFQTQSLAGPELRLLLLLCISELLNLIILVVSLSFNR